MSIPPSRKVGNATPRLRSVKFPTKPIDKVEKTILPPASWAQPRPDLAYSISFWLLRHCSGIA
jgi:hypothetical protein